MSECYFADGKIAPPTTFGKFFPGDKWGPLDSSVVQNNLDNLQPADPTPEPGPGDTETQPYDERANTIRCGVMVSGTTNHLSSLATKQLVPVNGLRSGSGSAADATAGFGENNYILVSNLGFTGTHSLKIKGLWSQVGIQRCCTEPSCYK